MTNATARRAVLVHPPLSAFEGQLSQYDVVHWPTARQDIEVAITVGHIGVTNAMIDALPDLKCIICFGVGVEGLDVAYAKQRGVAITHGREISHEDVADVAMGLLIAVARRFSLGERLLREGKWTPPVAVPPQRRLRGMKLGIVGMGAIGRAVSERAAAFGLDIAWTGPRPKPGVALRYEPDLLKLADWAGALVVAARGDQVGLVNAHVIRALGPDGILVNVSRGAVVDEDALIDALKSGALGGAGLDVFEQEPTPHTRWADVPNCTLTPHVGGGTREALLAGAMNVLANLHAFFETGEPLAASRL